MKVFTYTASLFRRGENGVTPAPGEFQFIAPSNDRASAPRRRGGYAIRPLCNGKPENVWWIRKKVPERYRPGRQSRGLAAPRHHRQAHCQHALRRHVGRPGARVGTPVRAVRDGIQRAKLNALS
jgi:hypothetical protein